MWDALFAGLSFAASDSGRSLVLLFTDGLDNASWLTEKQVTDSLKRAESVVYVVHPMVEGTARNVSTLGPDRLRKVAEQTGGSLLEAEWSEKAVPAVRRDRHGVPVALPPALRARRRRARRWVASRGGARQRQIGERAGAPGVLRDPAGPAPLKFLAPVNRRAGQAEHLRRASPARGAPAGRTARARPRPSAPPCTACRWWTRRRAPSRRRAACRG